jgi:hypothetical protein
MHACTHLVREALYGAHRDGVSGRLRVGGVRIGLGQAWDHGLQYSRKKKNNNNTRQDEGGREGGRESERYVRRATDLDAAHVASGPGVDHANAVPYALFVEIHASVRVVLSQTIGNHNSN